MLLVLGCYISIGGYEFTSAHSVVVKKSIHSFVDTATIELPTTARLRGVGSLPSATVQTAKQFKEGDKVVINMGYNGRLTQEFAGFVKRVNFSTPISIECEGYNYLLRKKTVKKVFKTNLKDVIHELAKDLDIAPHSSIPDIALTRGLVCNTISASEVLNLLRDKYYVSSYFIGNVLYCGLLYVPDQGRVKLALNGNKQNVIDANALKYRLADEVKVQIKAYSYKDNGVRIEATVGKSGGIERELRLPCSDKDSLANLATAELKKYQYNGYEGKLTSFLEPYATHGMIADITDTLYSERSGSYYVESVEVQYGQGGGRRILEIGVKANAQK